MPVEVFREVAVRVELPLALFTRVVWLEVTTAELEAAVAEEVTARDEEAALETTLDAALEAALEAALLVPAAALELAAAVLLATALVALALPTKSNWEL